MPSLRRAVTDVAVLGRPIAHSLSPALHRAAYAELGLTDWSYDRFDVGEDELRASSRIRDESWRGLSLTMPLKEAALALGDADPVALEAGAANTLIFSTAIAAGSTTPTWQDWWLRSVGPRLEAATRAIILGAGATARSAVASAARPGGGAADGGRPQSRSERNLCWTSRRRLGLDAPSRPWGSPLPPADLLISTLTAGAIGSTTPPPAPAPWREALR